MDDDVAQSHENLDMNAEIPASYREGTALAGPPDTALGVFSGYR